MTCAGLTNTSNGCLITRPFEVYRLIVELNLKLANVWNPIDKGGKSFSPLLNPRRRGITIWAKAPVPRILNMKTCSSKGIGH